MPSALRRVARSGGNLEWPIVHQALQRSPSELFVAGIIGAVYADRLLNHAEGNVCVSEGNFAGGKPVTVCLFPLRSRLLKLPAI